MKNTLSMLSNKLDRILSAQYNGKDTMLTDRDIIFLNSTVSKFRLDVTGSGRENGGFPRAIAIDFILRQATTKEKLIETHSKSEDEFKKELPKLTTKVQEFYDTLKNNIQSNENHESPQYKTDVAWVIEDMLYRFRIFKQGDQRLPDFVNGIVSNTPLEFQSNEASQASTARQ